MSDLVTRERDGVLIIYFNKDVIRSEIDVRRTSEELANLAHSAGDKVVLDFTNLQQMSSSMIGKLLALSQECASRKITLRLCNLQPHIKEVFTATNLDRVLKIHDTQEQALAAFRKKGWLW